MREQVLSLVLAVLAVVAAPCAIAEAAFTELAGGFQFTEGPTVAPDGSVFFSDIDACKTHKRAPDGKITVFRENTSRANGMEFDRDGKLLVCEGATGRLVAVDKEGSVTVLVDKYDGKRFNQPNDLWIDPKSGVYFTDPLYGQGARAQDGEHVYYLKPGRKEVIRVVNDMVRPNGIVGTPDGKSIYITDAGGGKTWKYSINSDGTLGNKTLFVPKGSDGMTLDRDGNLYLTSGAVEGYDPSGKLIGRVKLPQAPTNVCIYGPEGRVLFVTARKSIYSIPLPIK